MLNTVVAMHKATVVADRFLFLLLSCFCFKISWLQAWVVGCLIDLFMVVLVLCCRVVCFGDLFVFFENCGKKTEMFEKGGEM